MSSSTSESENTLGQHHVAQLRDKLLDLSNSNRLLNFKHSPRARTHVRIIDELPEFLLDALCDGRDLAFQSLGPEPRLQTPPTGQQPIMRTPEDVAKDVGLNGSYDLPEVGTEQEGRHADRYVQTLLFDQVMERKLNGIRQEWQLGLNERGVDTLFAAFGFLEWYESDSSNKPLHAPLLLHPLEMERKLVAGRYEFLIRSTGEESQINLALAARLRRDFRLELPELTEEVHLTRYLEEVRTATAPFKRWRVRRFVTIGIYGFARLVMYRDLEEATWPEGRKPAQHPLVRTLLSERTDGALTTADDYPLDDPPHVAVLPPLVSSADSSQTSAIVDVLQGKNLALKGPPGTGKSQTITNLIAAALHQGKSVLFVAEKMAALEVVQKRLADAGLAEFCLELHSTRAKKTWLLDRLRARMQMQNAIKLPSSIDGHRRSLAELRSRLNSYVRAWNSPAGSAGLTVHDAVWLEQAGRANTHDIAGAIGDLLMHTAGGLSSDALAELRGRASRLADAAARCERDGLEPRWGFVDSGSLSVLDVPAIVQNAEQAKSALEACVRALAAIDGEAAQQWTLTQARAEARALTGLPLAGVEQPLLSNLASSDLREAVKVLVVQLERRSQNLEVLGRVSVDAKRLVGQRQSLEDVVRALDPTPYASETIGSLGAFLNQQEQRLTILSAARDLVCRAFSLLGVESEFSASGLEVLVRARQLLGEGDRRVLLARSPQVMEERNGPRLLAARDAQRTLQERERALATDLNLKGAPDAPMLRLHAVRLRTARWYSWLSGAFRAARSAYLFLARGRKAPWTAMADRLDDLAEVSEGKASLADDARLREIAGAQFHGADSDFETLHAANVWATQVRRQLAGATPCASRLRSILLSESIEVLDDFVACFREPGWEVVQQWLAKAKSDPSVTLEHEIERGRQAATALRASRQTLDALPIRGDVQVRELSELARAAQAIAQAEAAIEGFGDRKTCLGSVWAGSDTDAARLKAALTLCEHIEGGVHSPRLRAQLRAASTPQALEIPRNQARELDRCLDALSQHQARCRAMGMDLGRLEARLGSEVPLARLIDELGACLGDRDALTQWINLVAARRAAHEGGLSPILERLAAAGISLVRAAGAFEWTYHRSVIADAFAREPMLAEYAGLQMDEARRRFRELDEQLVVLERQEIAAGLCVRQPPSGIGTGPRGQWSERHLIEHELTKKARHLPIRQLVQRAGGALQTLTPCFMMSPISVAQYLPPGSIEFDLLVVDEASQMRTEDALGALCRAKQTVVVGDPKQLPPSAFFQRMETDEDQDDEVDEPPSAESVLDLALGAFQPARDLRWHYRSKHESLIAFSNYHFYDNRLQIFPSPEPQNVNLGVELRLVKGTFQASVNEAEAREVAETAVAFMEQHPERSLGVVAMNQKQSQLIEEYVDELARTRPLAEAYRSAWSGGLEAFFVKNLENVQGDERDAILIGMTYGPDPKAGRVFQRFGPINGASGHRRLNVLFTRAKERVIVISSMVASDIIAGENSSLGVRALKGYLQYAKDNLLEGGEGSARAPDSPFEVQVIGALRASGYEAIPQVGVRGFFIDIGIKHPSYPHGFLCGVECDGASYHSSRTARDRDRLREDILQRLGWRLVRIWSTDWFADPRGELARLLRVLGEIRAAAVGDKGPMRAAGE